MELIIISKIWLGASQLAWFTENLLSLCLLEYVSQFSLDKLAY